LHQQIETLMEVRDVKTMAEKQTRILNPEPRGEGGQPGLKTAGADDDQSKRGSLAGERRKGLD
jgi:hypothetical protein